MRLVLIPTDTVTEEGLHGLEGGVEALIEGDSCTVVEDGESMTAIAPEGSCFELHVGTGDDSSYTIDTTGMSGLAVFAQHVPIEFERDQHYLKDSSGTDIEPVAQEGAGEHDHDGATVTTGTSMENTRTYVPQHHYAPKLRVHRGRVRGRRQHVDGRGAPRNSLPQHHYAPELRVYRGRVRGRRPHLDGRGTPRSAITMPEIHARPREEEVLISFPAEEGNHSDGDEDHEAGYAVIHIEEEGDYGFAVPTGVDFHIITDAPQGIRVGRCFEIADNTHSWSMQAVAGDHGTLAYADPSMRLVLIPTDTVTEEGLHGLEGGVEALIEGDSCTVVEDGESMTAIAPEGNPASSST